MDEVHFQQHGSRCRMWIPPEVEDPADLGAVGPLVGSGLSGRELPPSLGFTRGIPDPAREITDDQYGLVPGVLEHPQHPQRHHVAEVQIGRGGVNAEFHAEVFAAAQVLPQVGRNNDFSAPRLQE